MPRKRKKKTVRTIYPSAEPLPLRLAAILFATPDSEALVRTRTVPITGSNELELQAALFALEQARDLFPGQPLALFSDNQDAVVRLNLSKTHGLNQDPELHQMLGALDLVETLAHASVCWIKGHGSCRGNILADQHAAEAAG